jgi:glycosyltransferase involved in cell wall biosynthesis
MDKPGELKHAQKGQVGADLPLSLIIAGKNEARNLRRCLESIRHVSEVFVIDSQSTDGTVEVARNVGAHLVQFYITGGVPRKGSGRSILFR